MKRLTKIAALISVLILLFSAYGCNKNEVKQKGENTDNTPVVTPTCASSDNPDKNSTEGEAPWKIVNQNKVDIAFVQAGFYNENIGVTVGLDGEVHYTDNGGKNWPRANNNSACRFGLDFADKDTLWHCGNADVGVSTDGGKTWTTQSKTFAENGYYISALDRNNAWVGNRTKVSVTTDGAKTFTNIKLPKDINSVASIFARSAKEGYLLNYDGSMFYTKDGGENWATSKIEDNGSPVKIRCDSDTTVSAALRILDEKNVIVAYCDENKGIWVMRSSDGGKSWTKEKATSDYANNIYMTHDGNYITYDGPENKITLIKHES